MRFWGFDRGVFWDQEHVYAFYQEILYVVEMIFLEWRGQVHFQNSGGDFLILWKFYHYQDQVLFNDRGRFSIAFSHFPWHVFPQVNFFIFFEHFFINHTLLSRSPIFKIKPHTFTQSISKTRSLFIKNPQTTKTTLTPHFLPNQKPRDQALCQKPSKKSKINLSFIKSKTKTHPHPHPL